MRELAKKIIEKRLAHYVISGATAFTIEYGSFLILYYSLHVHAVVANTISFSLGLLTSFLLNRLWVFGQSEHNMQVTNQLSLYLITGLINLLITDVAIHFLVRAGIPAFLDKVGLVILVACWNFIIFKKIIFAHKKDVV